MICFSGSLDQLHITVLLEYWDGNFLPKGANYASHSEAPINPTFHKKRHGSGDPRQQY